MFEDWPFDFTYGIEIEFEGISIESVAKRLKDDNLSSWKVVSDISVTENNNIGGEIVSGILTNDSADFEEIRIVCNILEKNGAYISNYTGGHIHVGAHILESEINNFKNLLKIWIAFENVIYRFAWCDSSNIRAYYKSSASPFSCQYNEMVNKINDIKTFDDLYNFIKDIKESNVCYGMNLNNLNLINGVRHRLGIPKDLSLEERLKFLLMSDKCIGLGSEEVRPTFNNEKSYRNTIEFTVFNSSINADIWIENINFLARLLRYVKSREFNIELIDEKLKLFQGNVDEETLKMEAHLLAELVFMSGEEKVCFLNRFNKREKSLNEKLL